jgi:Winged helix DNA-binding domain
METLTQRALNRALLARQQLLERSTRTMTEIIEQVGGLQTQYAPAGYIGMWSRLAGFERPMLTRALEDRTVVQATMMRATIHMVSAADYWPMTLGQRRVRREWFANVARREIEKLDMDGAAAATRQVLADGPLRIGELSERLAERGFGGRAPNWVGMWVDLVRVPPSGTWDRRRADIYGLADAWVGPAPSDLTEDAGIEHLVRRYLGAFGPAALKDVAGWMGRAVGQIRHVADAMELRAFVDEAGKPLVDLPDAPLPDPSTPAPPRFLPVWDASLLVHARRTQILPEEHRAKVFNTKTPHSVNTFLLDGQVAGTWRFESGRIELALFGRISAADRRALDEEAEGLAALHA